MPDFYASSPVGLAEALEKELQDLGLKTLARHKTGVLFESPWAGCYKANLHSRLASRILKPILDFTAYQPDELYGQILKHDFTKYIPETGTLAVDAVVSDGMMRDQRFVALKVKDAIVDQFREKTGSRPDVDAKNPDLRIVVRANRNKFQVSLDTSGDGLFQRGYRKAAGEAPLKENLAAGLIKLSGWTGDQPLVDLMTGAGTFAIEAALMALNVAPGVLRSRFAFQKWLNFDAQAWDELVEAAMDQEKPDLPFKIYGFELDKQTLIKAKDNARRAGVDHVIEWKREHIATIDCPPELGMAIVNPPYGARLGEEDNLRDVYRDLGYTLKHKFPGWSCWVLSGNRNLIQDMHLKSSQRHYVYNGAIECRFLKYEMKH